MSPPVAVLTPVYNGEAYLAECIESVLAQSYRDFDYTIVDNCSTDSSLEIARSYERRDRRVRVRCFETFVDAIGNHNRAFALVPPDARYCKVVSADDRILEDCVARLIRLAEAHPEVGVVGCYQRSGERTKWTGVPPEVSVLSGRDAARLGLLHGIHVLGTPTSVLYRGDLVRMRPEFFPNSKSYADTSACYECFKTADFGFVHETLAVERVHEGQWSTRMDRMAAGSTGYLDVLLQYGPFFLTESEFEARKAEVFDRYYRFLGGCLLKLKGREFWAFQSARLGELGYHLEWGSVLLKAVREVAEESRRPLAALQKLTAVLNEKVRG